jgi:hypothetical protein
MPPLSSQPNPPLSVFVSYAHADETLKDELVIHLATLKRQGKIQAWQDRDIEAGAEWDAGIKAQLEMAEIVLLLISPRFLASDYCYDLEMQRAIERHDAGTARVIPIILKSCDWQGTPFSKLQVLPKDGKPIVKWDDRDEAFLNVVQGIRRVVESLQAQGSRRGSIAPSTATPVASAGSIVRPTIAPASAQHHRLTQQQADLQAAWDLKMENLKRLREALAIEAGVNLKFQLEKQVEAAEAELADLTRKLEDIEHLLEGKKPY